jgi:lysophospholipase L1-like esterase
MITDNLTSMVQIAHANGIKVVLASITPAYDYPWRTGLEPSKKIVVVNQWMKDYCAKGNCIYADYYSAMVDDRPGMKEGLARDEVHPTPEGYKIMAPIAEAAIARALAQ